jgi:hypothetical protein
MLDAIEMMIGLGIIGFVVYTVIKSVQAKRNTKSILDKYQLKHEGNIAGGLLKKTDESEIKNTSWGEYNSRKVFMFFVYRQNDNFSSSKVFINGMYYSFEALDGLPGFIETGRLNYQGENAFNSTKTFSEFVQILRAHTYLNSGLELDYPTVKKVVEAAKEHIVSQKGTGGKILSKLSNLDEKEIREKFFETYNYIISRPPAGVDQRTIKEIYNAYNKMKSGQF